MWRDWSKTLRELLEMPGDAGAYRPDLHYMRGPGPKWHAKYDNLAPKTMPVARTARQAPREATGRHV